MRDREHAKHIHFYTHFAHGAAQAGETISLKPASEDQLADVITKSLPPPPLERRIIRHGQIDGARSLWDRPNVHAKALKAQAGKGVYKPARDCRAESALRRGDAILGQSPTWPGGAARGT